MIFYESLKKKMRNAFTERDTHSDLNVGEMPSNTSAARCVSRGAFEMDLMRKNIV